MNLTSNQRAILLIGAYMITLFLCNILATKISFLATLYLILLGAFPFVFLRIAHQSLSGTTIKLSFIRRFLYLLSLFTGALIILAFVQFAYFQWIDPHFLLLLKQQLIELLSKNSYPNSFLENVKQIQITSGIYTIASYVSASISGIFLCLFIALFPVKPSKPSND